MKRHHVLIGAVAIILLLVTGLAYAQGTGPERETTAQEALGTGFTYQGQLSDDNGPVDDTCDLTFELYDAPGSGTPPTGGTLLGTVGKPGQEIVEGLFTVELDFGGGVFNGDARWLQVTVDCGDGATTLSPRQELTAAPYALHADLLDGQHASAFAGASHDHLGETWAGSGNSLVITGTFDQPQSPAPLVLGNTGGNGLHVDSASADGVYVGSADGHGMHVGSAGATGVHVEEASHGVRVEQADHSGVIVDSAGWGISVGSAIWGVSVSTATYGLTVNSAGWDGVYVRSAGQDGVHVENAGGDGVFVSDAVDDGVTVVSAGNRGVAVNHADGDGLYVCSTGSPSGCSPSSGNHGVEIGNAESHGLNVTEAGGVGVYVDHAASDGVYVVSAEDDGVAVNSAGGDGVFVCHAGDGAGCWGYVENHGLEVGHAQHDGVHVTEAGDNGVQVEDAGNVGLRIDDSGSTGIVVETAGDHGLYVGTTTNDGVFVNNPGRDAGHFNGDVVVTGNVSKGGGSFKIDHPLDPENKYLNHSFVESPDMMNVYNGNVTTDGEGLATVTLPDYFEALNRDFRYQLTVIGTFAQAIVAQEIEDGQFVIQTDQPNVKVSWQVTGIRQDPYARANRIVVEEDKPPEERGTYLHPEAHGQPESRGLTTLRAQREGYEEPEAGREEP